MPFDIRQLIEMAPLVVGAMKPGSPEAAAIMRGWMRGQQMRQQQELQNRQLTRQDTLDQQRQAYQQAQMANLQADNARADQSFKLQQENAGLNRLERFRHAAGERANELIGGADLGWNPTDPSLQNQIALDQFNLANQYGVPGAQSTILPNTAAGLSGRKRNKAKEIYEQAEKTYGQEAMANDAITIRTGELFGDMKPSQLRALYQMPAMQTPSPTAPSAAGQPVPAKPYIPDPEAKTIGSFDAHFADVLAAAEEKAQRKLTRTEKAQLRLRAKKEYDAANDRPLDPMAHELAALRLEMMRAKNEPIDITPDVQTTIAGRAYVDLSSYQGEQRNKARDAANAAGAIAVSKEQANALQEIDNARLNQHAILDQISDLLPKGPGGRSVAALAVPLEKLFQTNDQIGAFNSWRTAAIQTLRATAGSKGLRINQAEIAQAIGNDIPKLTDTVGTAQQKLKNIETMLESAERSILVRDRSVTPKPGERRTFNGKVGEWDGKGWKLVQ